VLVSPSRDFFQFSFGSVEKFLVREKLRENGVSVDRRKFLALFGFGVAGVAAGAVSGSASPVLVDEAKVLPQAYWRMLNGGVPCGVTGAQGNAGPCGHVPAVSDWSEILSEVNEVLRDHQFFESPRK
jgi:hypothetical protein